MQADNMYRFACQIEAGQAVNIYSIRCDGELSEVFHFAARIAGTALVRCAFAEIHRICGNGAVEIVWADSTKKWPTDVDPNVKIISHAAIYSPKPAHVFTPALGTKEEETTTALTVVNEPSPAEKLLEGETIFYGGIDTYWREVA